MAGRRGKMLNKIHVKPVGMPMPHWPGCKWAGYPIIPIDKLRINHRPTDMRMGFFVFFPPSSILGSECE